MSTSETRLAGSMGEMLGEHRLGRLRRVDAQAVWPGGGQQLVPWLRSNPQLLGDALRLDIREGSAELPAEAVGELTPGLPVVVRARFDDPSEADVHQLAGLVAELDAGVVVQLAPAIPDTLRKRLVKLNRNTSKLITFYGVEFDLWQIDDSAPAPLFRVVVGPEGWDTSPQAKKDPRDTAAGGQSRAPSDTVPGAPTTATPT